MGEVIICSEVKWLYFCIIFFFLLEWGKPLVEGQASHVRSWPKCTQGLEVFMIVQHALTEAHWPVYAVGFAEAVRLPLSAAASGSSRASRPCLHAEPARCWLLAVSCGWLLLLLLSQRATRSMATRGSLPDAGTARGSGDEKTGKKVKIKSRESIRKKWVLVRAQRTTRTGPPMESEKVLIKNQLTSLPWRTQNTRKIFERGDHTRQSVRRKESRVLSRKLFFREYRYFYAIVNYAALPIPHELSSLAVIEVNY